MAGQNLNTSQSAVMGLGCETNQIVWPRRRAGTFDFEGGQDSNAKIERGSMAQVEQNLIVVALSYLRI